MMIFFVKKNFFNFQLTRKSQCRGEIKSIYITILSYTYIYIYTYIMYIHIHRYIYNVNLKKNRTCDIIFTTDKILLYIETLYIVSHSLFEHQYNLNKDRQCIISKVYLILDRKKKKKT